MTRPHYLLLLLPMLSLATGCTSRVSPPTVGLQRTLYPGLADGGSDAIPALLEKEVVLEAPLSAGVAWLNESRAGSVNWTPPLSDFQRTGVIEAAIDALETPPFSLVAALPTVPEAGDRPADASPLEGLRTAAARFQYDVAIVLQTGLAQDSGVNPFAIGYLGIVTAPLFPGNDFAIAASAEACAVDVRSGVMLGCGVGRAERISRFNFPLSVSSRRDHALEDATREAVIAAARRVREQVAQRLSDG